MLFGKNSVTVDEESLHAAIMEAIHATRGLRREMLPVLAAHVERTLREKSGGTINVEQSEVSEHNDCLVRQLIKTIEIKVSTVILILKMQCIEKRSKNRGGFEGKITLGGKLVSLTPRANLIHMNTPIPCC